MDVNQLLKLDMGSILKSLFSNKSSATNPRAKFILYGLAGFLVVVAYVAFVFLPNHERQNMMEEKIANMSAMESKLKYLDLSTKKAQTELALAEVNYEELNQLFAVETELEDLYHRISQMATSQRLLINAVAKEGEDAIYADNKVQPNTPGAPPPKPPPAGANAKPAGPPLFYRIKLKMEMTGTYSSYMRFRRQLASFNKSINIDKEQILLIPGDSRGVVQVKVQLSTIRLPQKLVIDKPTSPNPFIKPMSWGGYDDVRVIKIADLNDKQSAPDNRNQTGRDPFSRASSGMIEGGRDPRISPLIMADPQSYVITGLIISSKEKAALIRTDFRENFIVKIGDALGNQGGIISEIDANGIVVTQAEGKLRLYLQTNPGASAPAFDPMKPGAPSVGK